VSKFVLPSVYSYAGCNLAKYMDKHRIKPDCRPFQLVRICLSCLRKGGLFCFVNYAHTHTHKLSLTYNNNTKFIKCHNAVRWLQICGWQL